jgi:hypothetical protein
MASPDPWSVRVVILSIGSSPACGRTLGASCPRLRACGWCRSAPGSAARVAGGAVAWGNAFVAALRGTRQLPRTVAAARTGSGDRLGFVPLARSESPADADALMELSRRRETPRPLEAIGVASGATARLLGGWPGRVRGRARHAPHRHAPRAGGARHDARLRRRRGPAVMVSPSILRSGVWVWR